MIKKTLFSICCLTIISFAYGQRANRQYDSLIKRVIERNVANARCDSCPRTGVCVIKVEKTDSVRIGLLYASSETFDVTRNKTFLISMNRYCRDYIKEKYAVIVPLYFYFNDDSPADELLTDVELRIIDWKLKRHKNVTEPILFNTFEQRRKATATGKTSRNSNDGTDYYSISSAYH